MQVIRSISTLAAPLENSLVTIGNFDGVHRGHQSLIRQVQKHAHPGQPIVVMTFDPHPSQVLHPERPFLRLTDREDLTDLLFNLGVDYLVVEPFTVEYSKMPARDFLESRVFKPLRPEWLVVGYDFAFGKDRGGDYELVRAMCKEHGVHCEKVEPLTLNGEVVSSRGIREWIRQGDLHKTREWLGRNFSLTGKVVHGAGRGHGLGFATLNVEPTVNTYPQQGVYATRATVVGKAYPSVTNVGVAPTFDDGGPVRVECHVLDIHLDAYGEKVKIEFVERLRDEIKFPSVEDLKTQIAKDVQRTRAILRVP